MVLNLFSPIFEFPSDLEKFIFDDLRGDYKRDPEKVKITLDADENDMRTYLGTYFPRSFSESYVIFEDLFNQEYIKNNFENKNELFILDIGSGMGGELLGLLWLMKNNLNDFPNKKLHILSIDGNAIALDIQEILIKQFFPNVKNIVFQKLIISKKDFHNSLKNIIEMNNFKIKFDIIMTFKLTNELYRETYLFNWNEISGNHKELFKKYLRDVIGIFWVNNAEIEYIDNGMTIKISSENRSLLLIFDYESESAILTDNNKILYEFIAKKKNNQLNIYSDNYTKNKGMYKIITEAISDYLDEKGLFILSDVTDKINDNTNLLLPKIMNREIVEYSKIEDCKLKIIIPLSCAYWSTFCKTKNCFTKREIFFRTIHGLKNSNYSYKIFSKKETALRILEHNKQDIYNIGLNKSCTKGVYNYRDKKASNYRDAFSLENIE